MIETTNILYHLEDDPDGYWVSYDLKLEINSADISYTDTTYYIWDAGTCSGLGQWNRSIFRYISRSDMNGRQVSCMGSLEVSRGGSFNE